MKLHAERERRSKLFPPNTRCESCAETDPLVLIPDARMTLCADCDAIRHGRLPIEAHHLAGKLNGPWTIIVSANMHRRLTIRQRLRPDRRLAR